MPRIKRSVQARKHRKNILKHAKGFKYGRKSKFKLAKDALRHAWTYAFRDRKAKKRTNRGLQNLQINAATRSQGVTYSKFIAGLKAKKIELDRKVLSQLAQAYPEIFSKIVEEVKTK
ncbi:MAG TPA: 50S ribosomal protein L20 [Candidatus Staskawiczbacteria bacterium]|nr:50S ribosomal protein L20 [Candidatus Staskawiczbacteria bacterium]